MKILVVRPLSSISTNLAFGEGKLKMGIPHLNELCFLFSKFLGAATHTVLTEFDDQKLSSRGMASIKSTACLFI